MSERRWLYLDWNATTPPLPQVVEEMARVAAVEWANPASVHRPGQRARAQLERARRAVAALTQFDPRDVTLTAGGTEANNLAMWHPFAAAEGGTSRGAIGGRVIVSRLEHPSVVRTAERLGRAGATLIWLPVPGDGRIQPAAVAEALAQPEPGPTLICLQAVNHETGVIQPVADVAALLAAERAAAGERPDTWFHVDAVQALGKLPAASWLGADSVTVAAHKFRGPKGIGALATRARTKLSPLLGGGDQEKGARPGSQSASLAAGMALAAERACSGPERYAAVASLRDRLERALIDLGQELGIAVERNGSAERIAHVSNLSWARWRGPELCAALDLEGVAVSSGSACSAGTAEPSPVVTAMLGEARARSAVRISLGEDADETLVQQVIAAWRAVLERSLRH